MKKSTIAILSLIMFINALSIGLIIPLLYPLASQFGLSPLGLSVLFTSFSIAQFFATPVLGKLSDRYGRKPILLICLAGTAVAFSLMATAQTVVWLFAARIFDGITGGNMSVANAVVADSSTKEERPKAYGFLGASFGFGFLLGPAIGGALSNFSIQTPFWFASALSVAGVIFGFFALKESNENKTSNQFSFKEYFHFARPFSSLKKPFVGSLILITLLVSMAHNGMIIGFQTYTVDVLNLTPSQIGWFFTGFASVSILMQVMGIKYLLKKFDDKLKILLGALIFMSVGMVISYVSDSFWPFFVSIFIYGSMSSVREPMLQSLLSENTPADQQGKLLGINQSYTSLGQIVGPLIAGLISTVNLSYIFLVSAIYIAGAFVVGLLVKRPKL